MDILLCDELRTPSMDYDGSVETDKKLDYVVRRMQPSDRNFVFKGWLSSFVDSPWGRSMPKHEARMIQAAVIEQTLRSPICRAYVIADSKPDSLWLGGFLVAENEVLHYGFVRPNFRRLGLFDAMFTVANFDHPITLMSHVRVPWSDHIRDAYHLTEDKSRC